MAIYHCSTKTIGRAAGRTAVAASAYRSGEKLKDDRTGLTHDFTRKEGVAHSEIISNLGVPIDRSDLWNMAERAENRKDARTAREWVIALPEELDAEQRKDAAREFAQNLVDKYGVVADLAIHEPSKSGDDRNHHAHIMLTTRKAIQDGDKVALTDKTDIELSNTKREKLGLGTTQDEIKEIRGMWADVANRALERAGQHQKIDHRSYADQGNGLRPQIHENNEVTQLRRQGKGTVISRYNDRVKQFNAKEIEREQLGNEKIVSGAVGKAENRLEQWQKQQEMKQQEQARQEQLRQQQIAEKQRAERASRQSSRGNDRGGMEL